MFDVQKVVAGHFFCSQKNLFFKNLNMTNSSLSSYLVQMYQILCVWLAFMCVLCWFIM